MPGLSAFLPQAYPWVVALSILSSILFGASKFAALFVHWDLEKQRLSVVKDLISALPAEDRSDVSFDELLKPSAPPRPWKVAKEKEVQSAKPKTTTKPKTTASLGHRH